VTAPAGETPLGPLCFFDRFVRTVRPVSDISSGCQSGQGMQVNEKASIPFGTEAFVVDHKPGEEG